MSQRWEQIISQLPPKYVADQFMGKAPDKLELEAKIEQPKGNLSQSQVDRINKIVFENWYEK